MPWSPALPILTLVVWTPAAGALIAALPGENRARLRRALSLGFATVTLALALFLAFTFEGGGNLRELSRWTPALGLSYELVLDAFESILVPWIALLAVLALLYLDSRDLGGRETSLLLLAETALLGLATSADAALLLGFYGAGVLSFTLLLGRLEEMKKFFCFQAAGVALALAHVAVSYHLAWVQTGFPSSEMARFASLVSFPEFQRRMSLAGAAVLLFAAPLFPLTAWVSSSARTLAIPGRLLLLGGWSLAGSLFFVRAVSSSYPPGDGAEAVALLAAFSVLYAGVASRRSWPALLVGFQGLVVLGLLSETAPGIASGRAGMLHSSLALTAIVLWKGDSEDARGPALAGGIAALTFLLPFWRVLYDRWTSDPAVAALAGLGVTLMAAHLLRTLPPLPRRRILLLVPLLVGIWVLALAPPSRFVPPGSTAPSTEEE